MTAVKHNKRSRRKQRHLPYVADSILLEESGMPWLVRSSIFAAAAIVALFIAWSAVTRSAEISVAAGWIKPSGNVQAIQHLEGGIVTQILVSEGDIVESGQTLVKLEPASVGSDLARVTGRHRALTFRAERLQAFIEGREPDFGEVASQDALLAENQRQILAGQLAAREASRQVFLQQLSGQQSQSAGLDTRARNTRKHIALLKSELDARSGLAAKGLSSKFQLLRSQQEMNRAQGVLAQIAAEKDQLSRSMAETRGRIEELEATTRADALTELGAVTDDLRDMQEAIQKQGNRFQRLDLQAPVRGIVQALNIHTVGGVINSGETILEIVPINDELVAEVRLSPRDIGHISAGQGAKLKFTTFDFARHGSIDGILKSVSATTLFDDEGQPYYRGIVELDQNYVGENPALRQITPGMTLSAEILTQERSLLTYLLKPVYRGLNGSFHER
ncbi:MAG: HlyD family type I secretion periplasmic adaptor subunit [Alphaproteobacteria bacterium]|nr:HlyD family type I secretion periplasmic adaptor subunit [Alphaproteobacteria bacterium]